MDKKKKQAIRRISQLVKETNSHRIIVAFSGGKDSTAVLHLAFEYAMANGCSLSILHGDTLVENPVIREYCDILLQKILEYNKYISTKKIQLYISKPEPQNTFWVNLIGKGYPMPSFRFRWCQNHLKIKPSRKILKKLDGILLVGMRMEESSERKKSMVKRMNNMELGTNGGIRIFAPLYDWTTRDVWDFLLNNPPPWGGEYTELFLLYRDARGECPLVTEKGFRGAGCGARFGCWVCSVVREDKTMKNLAKSDRKLQSLLDFRNWLIKFTSCKDNRLPFTRKGKPAKDGKGVLSLEARKQMLLSLLRLQNNIKTSLIKPYEIRIIRKMWEEDIKKFKVLVRANSWTVTKSELDTSF